MLVIGERGTGELIEEAVTLGYNPGSAQQAMRWTVGRIALHTGIHHASEITDDHITRRWKPSAV